MILISHSKAKSFHFSDYEFSVGDILTPQESGYVHLPESYAMEYWLEHFRPAKCLSRSSSVFSTPDEPCGAINGRAIYGAEGSLFIVTLESVYNPANLSDLNWLSPFDQGFEDPNELLEDYTYTELEAAMLSYWKGSESSAPSWEYRTHRSKVVDIRYSNDT